MFLLHFRTILAAMHYNENADRAQATTKAGKRRHSLHYPKYKRGGHVVKKILSSATYGKDTWHRWKIGTLDLCSKQVLKSVI